jgi:HK97 gp10 family phage protein
MTYRAYLTGVKETVATIKKIGGEIAHYEARNAVSAAGGVFKRAMQAAAPVESGIMKRNIVARIGKNRKGEWYGAIGARRKAKQKYGDSRVGEYVAYRKNGTARRITEKRMLAITKKGGRIGYRQPSRYIHLTEKRNASSAGWVARTMESNTNAAAAAAIRQLQKVLRKHTRRSAA